MKKFVRHIAIHTDIVIKAKNITAAQKILEETQLTTDTKKISFENSDIRMEDMWIEYND